MRDWRGRNAGLALASGALVLAPWLVTWPALLYARSPELFAAWLTQGRPGRTCPCAPPGSPPGRNWARSPGSPGRRGRSRYGRCGCIAGSRVRRGVALPLIALIAEMVLALLARAQGELPLLPVLLPLSLLGAQVLSDLRRGAANSLAWFGAMTFSLLGGIIWLGYLALQTGFPPRIAANAARVEPGFVSHFAWLPFVAAAAITVAWFLLILRSENASQRCVTFWAAGLALFWALTMLLWLPWIEHGKSYRPVALSLRSHLPKHPGCIASRGLGEAQRAVLDYHAGIVTERSDVGAGRDCALLLVQENARLPEASPGASWKKIWEGNRAGDRAEKWRLYAKSKSTP